MFKLGRLFGVEISMHWGAFVLMALITMNIVGFLSGKFPDSGSAAVHLGAILVSAGVMISILAHEFGHVLTARMFGVECDYVTLHMLGGVAGIRNKKPVLGTAVVTSANFSFWGPLSRGGGDNFLQFQNHTSCSGLFAETRPLRLGRSATCRRLVQPLRLRRRAK